MLKREMVSTALLGVLRARFSILVLCASLLCLAAVCAAGPEDAGEEVNVTVEAACAPRPGVGCTILRPVGWTVWGVGCIEWPNTPIFVEDERVYTAIAVQPSPLYGSGSTTLLCDGGCLTTISKSCRKTGGVEP
jgi:hypothetical protein